MGEVTRVTVDPDPPPESGTPNGSALPQGEAFANLREKFHGDNAVEQLAASYVELERRLSGQGEGPTETGRGLAAGAPEPDAGTAENLLDMDALSEVFGEYAESGSLSDATYAKLQKRGIHRSVVDNVIEGQLARAERIERAGLEVVGGRDNYDVMTKWAVDNLTQSELDAYNASVQSGDVSRARLAVEALAYRYTKANGGMPDAMGKSDPSQTPIPRVEGSTGPDTGSGGYRDMHELQRALADPRYEQSPSYRAEVDRKARLMPNDALKLV